MATIQERAKNVMSDEFCYAMNMGRRDGYIIGVTDQRKIDIDKALDWIFNNYADVYNEEINDCKYGDGWRIDFLKAMLE